VSVFISEDYIRSLEVQYKGQFVAQELYGEFVRFEVWHFYTYP